MSDQPHVPDPETAKRLLTNLHRTHLEMAEFNLELEEITARLEHDIRQQRLKRVRRSLNVLPAESNDSEQNPAKVSN